MYFSAISKRIPVGGIITTFTQLRPLALLVREHWVTVTSCSPAAVWQCQKLFLFLCPSCAASRTLHRIMPLTHCFPSLSLSTWLSFFQSWPLLIIWSSPIPLYLSSLLSFFPFYPTLTPHLSFIGFSPSPQSPWWHNLKFPRTFIF